MVALSALWLPILLSAVACFFAGFIMWVVLPYHRSDWGGLPDEDAVMDVLRTQGATPGMYHMPHAPDPESQKDPALIEKMKRGPAGFVLIVDGEAQLNMGKTLMLNFLFLLLVGFFIAYLASSTLPMGTDYLKVFQVTGTAGILAYSMGAFHKAIFWGWSWSVAFKEIFDGVVYALLTAGVFGWLWPV